MDRNERPIISIDNFVELHSISGMVRLQDELLPYHPDARTLHRPYGETEEKPQGLLGSSMPTRDLVELVADRRSSILHHATEVTHRLIGIMASELELSDLYREVPPRILCSDYIHTKREWSAGMEDGYYEIAGSFFVCREVMPARIDSRLRDIIGPVIHYDTEHLRDPNLNTYFEESLHYLQWLHQTPRETLDKIVGIP